MSALTMSGDFGLEKPVNRARQEAPLGGSSITSQPVAEVVAEPVKEKKMEKAATLPVAETGTPIGERLGALGRAILPPLLGMVVLIGIWYIATMKGGSIPGPLQTWDAAVDCLPTRSTATVRTIRASAGTSCPRCNALASASALPRWSAFRSVSFSAARRSCRQ